MLQFEQSPEHPSHPVLPFLREYIRAKTASPASIAITATIIIDAVFTVILLKNHVADYINEHAAYPCHRALEQHHKECILSAELSLN